MERIPTYENSLDKHMGARIFQHLLPAIARAREILRPSHAYSVNSSGLIFQAIVHRFSSKRSRQTMVPG